MAKCQACGGNAGFVKTIACKKGCTFSVCQGCHSAPLSKMPKKCTKCNESTPNWVGK